MSSFAGRTTHLNDIPLGASAGSKNGLTLLLDAESFEIGGLGSNGVTGFKLALADPKDVPFLSDHVSYFAPGNKMFQINFFQITQTKLSYA